MGIFLLGLLVNGVTALITGGVKGAAKMQANEQAVDDLDYEIERTETDAEIARQKARDDAEYLNTLASGVEARAAADIENIRLEGRERKRLMGEQLNRILSRQKVGTAASGFKTKSATTAVLADASNVSYKKDVETLNKNIEGKVNAINVQAGIDAGAYRSQATQVLNAGEASYTEGMDYVKYMQGRRETIQEDIDNYSFGEYISDIFI